MREDGDNIMEVESYILNPSHHTVHMQTTTNMSGHRKPVDRVGDLEVYHLRAVLNVPSLLQSGSSTPTDVLDISDAGNVKIIVCNPYIVEA